LNPQRYEEVARWQTEDLPYPTWAAPVVSHGLAYVRGRGVLSCLELIPAKN
jgi:hypothetical protein